MTSRFLGYSFVQAVAHSVSAICITLLFGGCSDNSDGATPPETKAPRVLGVPGSNLPGNNIPGDHQMAPMSMDVRVDLGAVRNLVEPTAKVFVFVRQTGERMPIGVEHYTVATLPTSITFSTTTSYPSVTVVARVSPSGKVERSAADFEAVESGSFGHPAPVINLNFDGAQPNSDIANSRKITTTTTTTPSAHQSRSIQIDLDMQIPAAQLNELGEQARLFVIAKATDSPMPLAVKSFSLDSIPTQVNLTDADAMMPTRLLSAASDIVVSARLSRSGDASRDAGDWEGISGAPSVDSPNQYRVTIDSKVR